MTDTHPHHLVATVRGDFDAVVKRTRAAITSADLWIIHEIDTQMLLRREGHIIGGTRQILYFHPRLMVSLLALNPAGISEVPLKMIVREIDTGLIELRSPDPVNTVGRYAGLGSLAMELSVLARQVFDAAVGIESCKSPVT